MRVGAKLFLNSESALDEVIINSGGIDAKLRAGGGVVFNLDRRR